MDKKKYILKPGKHQFAPGSHAVHDNDNLNDDDAKWYLEKYPHITGLFESIPSDDELADEPHAEMELIEIDPLLKPQKERGEKQKAIAVESAFTDQQESAKSEL
jgi:hypothetical protein